MGLKVESFRLVQVEIYSLRYLYTCHRSPSGRQCGSQPCGFVQVSNRRLMQMNADLLHRVCVCPRPSAVYNLLLIRQHAIISPSPTLAPCLDLNNTLCPPHDHFSQKDQQRSDQKHPAQTHMFHSGYDRVLPDITKQQ